MVGRCLRGAGCRRCTPPPMHVPAGCGPAAQQILVLGLRLDDSKHLADYGMQDKQELHMRMVRLLQALLAGRDSTHAHAEVVHVRLQKPAS